MKNSLRHAGALAALLAAIFASSVQAAGPQPRRADPAAAEAQVPATRYDSRDLVTRAAVATPSPVQNWKALNQVVASYDSMSLTMDVAEATPADAQLTQLSGATAAEPSPAHESDAPAAQPLVPDPHAHRKPDAVK